MKRNLVESVPISANFLKIWAKMAYFSQLRTLFGPIFIASHQYSSTILPKLSHLCID